VLEEQCLNVLNQMLNWIKASSFPNVKVQLEDALPEPKLRIAYQAIDKDHTVKGVKAAAGIGQKAYYDLIDKCIAMGLMEKVDGKARRLFDLNHFGLMPALTSDRQAEDAKGDISE